MTKSISSKIPKNHIWILGQNEQCLNIFLFVGLTIWGLLINFDWLVHCLIPLIPDGGKKINIFCLNECLFFLSPN